MKMMMVVMMVMMMMMVLMMFNITKVRNSGVETFVGWGGNEGGVAVAAPRFQPGMCQVVE